MSAATMEPWWILHVDNDEEDYLLTRAMLAQVQGRKIRLDWADNFAKAEALLVSNRYSAVLVDYDLGERSGIDLIRQAAARRYAAPLILYTGRASSEADMEAMQAGATLYLTKTEVTPLLLERFIRYAIEHRHYVDEVSRRLQERSDILESIQDGFFAIDRGWHMTYINRRAAAITGILPADLIGRNLWEAFPGLMGTVFEAAYRRVMREGVPEQLEAKGILSSAWYTVSIYPSPEGISVFWQDITQRKQSEETLKQSEAIYRAAAHNFPDGIILVVDKDSRYIVADGEALERLGFSSVVVEGIKVGEAAREPLRSHLLERFRRTLQGESQVYETQYQGRWLHTHYVPMRDENGEVLAAMALVQDITDQKVAGQLQKAAIDKYQMLFDTMLNGYALHEIISDDDGRPVDYRFLEVNPAFEQLTGMKAADILGKRATEAIPGLERTWIDIYGRVAQSGVPVQFENRAEAIGRTYAVYAFSPAQGQFATMFIDITSAKETEKELNEYAAMLKRSNLYLEEFALIASHDLREPLRKVKAYGDLLKSRAGSGLDEKSQDYLMHMLQASDRMEGMLEGLLAYSRVDSRPDPFCQVDLRLVAQEVLADLDVRLHQARGVVEIGDLPVIDAAPVQMRQLFQNLVGNALKFHRAGIPPRVRVSSQPGDANTVRLVVEDNGIGFSELDAAHLFQPFRRMVGRSAFEGSGMGLAICRKIAERHGGSISAQGRPGDGATFTVILPVKH